MQSSKQRNVSEIILEIRHLLDELASISEGRVLPIRQQVYSNSVNKKKPSGPSGGIKLLLSEGFFDEPKTLPEVVARLRQDGFNYVVQVISTALVRMVRAREMVRLPANGAGKEKWVYAARK